MIPTLTTECLTKDVQKMIATTSDPRHDTFQENICKHSRVLRHVEVHDRSPEGAASLLPALTSARQEGAVWRTGLVVCGLVYKQAITVEIVKSARNGREGENRQQGSDVDSS